MGILVSVVIGIVAVVIFIILDARNRKKLEEFDDFSGEIHKREKIEKSEIEKDEMRKKENFAESRDFLEKTSEYQKKMNNADWLGQKSVSINDSVELDYSQKSVEYSEEENLEYSKHIYFARENIIGGNFKITRKKLEKAAKINVYGNYELGKYYYYCENDIQKAKEMLSFAYNNGVKEATYYLGIIEEETGNFEVAKDWYNIGAEKGDVGSIVKLGKIAEEKKDYESAEKFYLQVKDTKDAPVMYNLIKLYFKQNMIDKVGEWKQKLLNESQITGLTLDIIKNIEFMLGNEKDKKFVELINQGNEFLEKKDYENAQKSFLEATNYNELGYIMLAKSYYAISDTEKAKKTFEKAYELGVKEAAYYLGEASDSIEDNEKEVEKWYKIGQEKGDIKSSYELAVLYECISDFGKSEEEAYEIYEKVAHMKYAPAMYDMMNYLMDQEDEKKVKEWAFKILNETGLIELDNRILKDAQEVLEEYGENIENRVLIKRKEINYDENLMYFIREALKK